MLELKLALNVVDGSVTVHCNGADSHDFPLSDLGQTEQQWKSFLADPAPYGDKLFQALFPPQSAAEKSLKALAVGETVALTLLSEQLESIFWEYAHRADGYLVEEFSFLRVLPPEEQPPLPSFPEAQERLPVLFIPSNPLDSPRPLNIAAEWHELVSQVRNSNAPVDLLELRPPTPEAFQTIMAGFSAGIVHFSGHGGVIDGGAALLFECENGAGQPYPAEEFYKDVVGRARAVLLSACQSAAPEKNMFGNLARVLVRKGVPFVLGMQFNLPDPFAPKLSKQFYNYLAHGSSLPEAVRQARRALKREHPVFVGLIALYVARLDVPMKLTLMGKGASLPATSYRPAQVDTLPVPERFLGRERDLLRIGDELAFNESRPLTVTLHGAGGIGKTALLRAALERFAPLFHDGAIALKFEPLPSLESTLGALEHFLGIAAANDTPMRLHLVKETLAARRIVLGLDNFETVIHARDGENAEQKGTARAIHNFLRDAANGKTVLVASSRTLTGLPGEIALDILGLKEEYGAEIFTAGIRKRRSDLTEAFARRVSVALRGHPLALRLLGPAFDDSPFAPEAFLEAVASLLPATSDKWTDEERHATLEACFNFSLGVLPEVLKKHLARLSIFRGSFLPDFAAPVLAADPASLLSEDGATPDAGLWQKTEDAIRPVLNDLWDRGQLERLIIVTGEKSSVHFFSMHPALRPFASAQMDAGEYEKAQDGYFRSMRYLARLAVPTGDKEHQGISGNPFLVLVCQQARADLIEAANSRKDASGSNLRYHSAFILRRFGDLDGAMKLYQQALSIDEGLGDLQGKSATLHEMAGIFVTRGDLDGAMKLYQQSLEIKEGLGDLQGKSATLHEMAYILRVRGDLDGAMKLYQQSLEIKEGLGDLQGKSATLHAMAYILRVRGDLDGAMKLYQQSLEIKEGLGDLKGKSATLHAMAGIFVTRGDLDGAMKLYQQALSILEGLGDLQGKSATLHEMAGIFVTRGDLDGAMKLYQQALSIDEGLGDLQGKSATLHEMAGIFVTRGDLDGAMKLYQQSLEIKEGLGDLQGKSATLHAMAYILRVRGDLDGAMKLYQQALSIDEGLGDLQGKSATLHEMAYILRVRGDLDGAMKLYQQSLEIKEGLGDLQGKSATLHAMAYILRVRGDLDGAMKLYQQALSIDEGLGDLQGKSATLHEMAGIFVTRGDLDGAMKLYQQSLEIKEGLGDLQGKSATLHAMAYILRVRGDLDGAMKLYQQALSIDEGLGDLQGKSATLAMMGQLLWESGNRPEGLKALVDSLGTLLKMGAQPDAEKVAGLLAGMRQDMGAEGFDLLWNKEIGQPLPSWLANAPRAEQGVSAEQFVSAVVEAARTKNERAGQYFEAVSKMAVNPEAPAELRALGKVLQNFMAGNLNPDLSTLPTELAEIVRKALQENLPQSPIKEPE